MQCGKLEIRSVATATAAIGEIVIRACLTRDDHELQRETTEEVRGHQLPREMRHGGERTGVRRCLRRPANAECRSLVGQLSLVADVQGTKAQSDKAHSKRTGFHGAKQQTTDRKRRRRELALGKAFQVDGG